jgi:hypothetical protein
MLLLHTCGYASPIQSGLPPLFSRATLAPSASARTEAHSHRGYLHIFREQSAVPLDLIRCFPFNGLRCPPRATLLLPGRVHLQPTHCHSSRITRDLPAHRRPARRAAAPPLPAAEPVYARPCRVTPALAHACSRHLGLLLPQSSYSRAPTAPPAPSARAPLNTCTRNRLPLRYRAYVRATRSAPLAFAPALPAVPLTSSRPLPVRHAPSLAPAHALAPVHLHTSRARSALLLLCTPEPHHLLPLAPRLLPSRAPTPVCRHPAHARLIPRPSRHATTAAAPRSAPRRSVRAAPALPTTPRLRSASHAPPAPPLCALRMHLPRSPRRLPSRAPAPGNRPAARRGCPSRAPPAARPPLASAPSACALAPPAHAPRLPASARARPGPPRQAPACLRVRPRATSRRPTCFCRSPPCGPHCASSRASARLLPLAWWRRGWKAGEHRWRKERGN